MNIRSRSIRLFFEMGILVGVVFLFTNLASKQPEQKSTPAQKSAAEAGEKTSSIGELRVLKKELAYPGFTLAPLNGSVKVFLLNMNGTIVHKWHIDADRARLLPNGNLLVVHGSKWGTTREPWKSMRPITREYDWDGNIIWEYTSEDIIHHDIQRLPNGNTLFVKRTIIPGNYKEKIADLNRRQIQIRSDSLVEVDRSGKIIWQWDAHNYLDLNSCGVRSCRDYSESENASKVLSDWTHINTVNTLPENKWFDAGDIRFRPGNLIIFPRNWWTAMIIDRKTKAVVWRYSGDYRGGLSGGHEPQMIEQGLPGAGNILLFDNGRYRKPAQSIVLEIDPVTQKELWTYEDGKNFFSRSAGAVQRLPNGNTFISEDVRGRIFEVTPTKEIVWELKSQYRSSRAKRYAQTYSEKFKDLPLYD